MIHLTRSHTIMPLSLIITCRWFCSKAFMAITHLLFKRIYLANSLSIQLIHCISLYKEPHISFLFFFNRLKSSIGTRGISGQALFYQLQQKSKIWSRIEPRIKVAHHCFTDQIWDIFFWSFELWMCVCVRMLRTSQTMKEFLIS